MEIRENGVQTEWNHGEWNPGNGITMEWNYEEWNLREWKYGKMEWSSDRMESRECDTDLWLVHSEE